MAPSRLNWHARLNPATRLRSVRREVTATEGAPDTLIVAGPKYYRSCSLVGIVVAVISVTKGELPWRLPAITLYSPSSDIDN